MVLLPLGLVGNCTFAAVDAFCVYTNMYIRTEADVCEIVAICGSTGLVSRQRREYFEDPDYVTEQDRDVDGEERWQTIGRIGDVMLLLVAHTVMDEHEDLVFRIISARQVTARERRRYEANTH